MDKRILVIKACGNCDEPHECNSICEQYQLYGIIPVCKCIKNNQDLDDVLASNGQFATQNIVEIGILL